MKQAEKKLIWAELTAQKFQKNHPFFLLIWATAQTPLF